MTDTIESLRQQLTECERERDELHLICRDAYEVWAGSEGIPQPETCAEQYVYDLLINMRDEVKRGLAKLGADKTAVLEKCRHQWVIDAEHPRHECCQKCGEVQDREIVGADKTGEK